MRPTIDRSTTPVQEVHGNEPPQPVVNFVRHVIRCEKFYPGPERRMHLRYPITLPVKTTPLTDDLQPDGEPFVAVTRDISVGGVCLYHLQPVKHHYLQLEMTAPGQRHLMVILEIVRCRQAGPFYEIGGPFLKEV